MATGRKGGDLFIVDNSVSGWTGLRYLEEWCGIAKSFDIATGFFEIGSLLVDCPRERYTMADAACGVGVFPAERLGVFGIGVDIAA